MNNKPSLDTIIYLSKEDDKYLVLGGIGTYISVLSREVKKLLPKTKVHWISLSPNEKDFKEIDSYGVKRHYLTGSITSSKDPFLPLLDQTNLELARRIIFDNKVNDLVKKILQNNNGKNVVIETGEWEGVGAGIFSSYSSVNIAKVVRVHTPLATCIKQNNLELTASTNHQLFSESQVLQAADKISACTEHVRNKVIKDVLGKSSKKIKDIVTIPNPIDVDNFRKQDSLRPRAISFINNKIGREFLSYSTVNIFILGSVEGRKGVGNVIKSVPEVIDRNKNIRFCFIGHCGDDEDKNLNANTKLSPKKLLASIPKKYHRFVGFTNYVAHETLPMVVQAGDIFPIMSVGDNFPGTVAEISLSEKSIIALKRGGVKEMLSNSRGVFIALSAGVSLVNAHKRLASQIIKLVSDEKQRLSLGKELRELMIAKYDPSKVTEKIIQSYRAILSKKLKSK